ncbi:hypothetical protein SAMN05880574_10130 [Chryseobacterium sp. RU37D]|uniref:hypothetical protein n=1 Tax=Chryseobacterium sp. RU37D TaxID=1907397 RepID=UPI000955A9F3|nr:hypothetical protein [Chryseobacterium sp. RU37D]SIP86245.1 hypothetical protein SAMN05880574_10130 [Chryseobacterium sp. RU37D]
MGIFEVIFQIIFTTLIGNNIYYLVRKIIGDKRSYKEIINSEKEDGWRYGTGMFVMFAFVIFLVKCTS